MLKPKSMSRLRIENPSLVNKYKSNQLFFTGIHLFFNQNLSCVEKYLPTLCIGASLYMPSKGYMTKVSMAIVDLLKLA